MSGSDDDCYRDPTGPPGLGDTVHDITFEDVTILNARAYAIRDEYGSAIRFNRSPRPAPASSGFYSSKGSSPAGVTITNSSLN